MCDLVVRVVGRKASCARPTLGWRLVEDHVEVVAVGSWLACEGTLCVGRTEPQRKSSRFFSAK